MSEVNVSGVRLTEEQVAFLEFVWGDAKEFFGGGDDDDILWDISKAVYDALPASVSAAASTGEKTQ